MLLDRLLENLAVTVEPFAVYEVASGWRLQMKPLESATLHFVLAGHGRLRADRGCWQALATHALAVVAPGLRSDIESGPEPASRTAAATPMTTDGELLRLQVGDPAGTGMVVACGRLQVTYGGGVGLFDLLYEPFVLDFSDSAEMTATFDRLLAEQRTASPGSRAMMGALMNQCLVLVFRRLCEAPECRLPWLAALEDPQLGCVLATVLERPELRHSVDSLAAEAFMSRSAFVERFTACFASSPMAFVRDVRLRRGAQFLRGTDLPVEAIAGRVGYASRSQFSRAFREAFGRSPAVFRAEPADGARKVAAGQS